MADIAKLDAVLKYIEEHPGQWHQGSWGHKEACGTAGCVAFHVGLHDGAEIVWDDFSLDGVASIEAIGEDGDTPWEYARRSLGLTQGQSDALFNGGNEMEQLKAMRDALAANPEATRDELYVEAYGAAVD